jgi:hypothetical protein
MKERFNEKLQVVSTEVNYLLGVIYFLQIGFCYMAESMWCCMKRKDG